MLVCAACAAARNSACAMHMCNVALLALSASCCIRAVLAYAACAYVRLGASRPVCSIAFALCLFVFQYVPLPALVYVPRMCAAWPFLPSLHHIAVALCLPVQLALLFALVYVLCM